MVAGTYQPERCGVAHYVQRLRAILEERGVSSVVLTTKEAARVSKDPSVKGVVRSWEAAHLPALVRAVRNARADVIHIQHAAGTYGFKRAIFLLPPLLRVAGVRAPLVTTVHEYAWWEWEPRFLPQRMLESMKEWGQRRGVWDREDGFLLTGSDALITTNTPIETAITERLPELATRMHRAPLATNIDVAPVNHDQAREEVRSRYGWPLNAPVVAYFGFLHPVKGIENLLKAHKEVLKDHPQARLLLLGGVESLALGEEAAWYWNELHTLVAQLGLDEMVAMTGYVPEEEVSQLLSGADVGALPFNHGVTLKSGTLLTLLAHGLPVVATRSDPPEPELAAGRVVQLVERRDISGLAAALSELLADASQRARLIEVGRAYCRHLSWPAIAERHLEVYETVLNKAGKA
jgi:glycosyltransferase involved in cell wall biosynthesis